MNLYPELNPKDAPAPITHYLTPGLTTLGKAANGGVVRGLYTASNGAGYAVIDSRVFFVDPAFGLNLIGNIAPGTKPVSMEDNETTIFLVDGSPNGYTIQLATNQFAQIVDPTGTFTGSDRVDFIDTFFIFNFPGTPQFGSTHSNSLVFDPLYFAAISDKANQLRGAAVANREIWMIGRDYSEVWYDAGNSLFPFAELPGIFIAYGTVAKYSIAVGTTKNDVEAVYWLSKNKQGHGQVVRGVGYRAQVVSTQAIDALIQSYGKIDDAQGFCYQQNGHSFYVLSFPTANKTWVFDDTNNLWHERAWMDQQGNFHRIRANCHAFMYGLNVVGDYENGTLYSLDPNAFTDAGAPIYRARAWPHLIADGNKVVYEEFALDMEVGSMAQASAGAIQTEADGDIQLEVGGGNIATEAAVPMAALTVMLRWSDNKGASFGNPIVLGTLVPGKSLQQLQRKRLGMARDRIFEVFWTAPVKTAINGAFIRPNPCVT